jgi:hypothetical protein
LGHVLEGVAFNVPDDAEPARKVGFYWSDFACNWFIFLTCEDCKRSARIEDSVCWFVGSWSVFLWRGGIREEILVDVRGV